MVQNPQVPRVMLIDPSTGYVSIDGRPWQKLPLPTAIAALDSGDDKWVCVDSCPFHGGEGPHYVWFVDGEADLCFGWPCTS